MIEYRKCGMSIALDTYGDTDLAARILDAFQWADAENVNTNFDGREWWASGKFKLEGDDKVYRYSSPGDSRLEAIEALRAKVESDENCEHEHEMGVCHICGDRIGEKVEPTPECSSCGTLSEMKGRGTCPECGRATCFECCTDHECAKVEPAGRPTVVGAEPDCIPASGHRFENGTCSKCGAVYNAVSPEDAATLAALNECRELGLYAAQDPNHDGVGLWYLCERISDGEDGFEMFADTLTEALAAYKAAQAPKDLRPTCWCCRKKWPDFPPEGIDAQVYPCGDCSELVRDMFIASRGPRCPDKPEDSEP